MKKTLALLTAAILTFCAVPMTAMAEEAALPTFHEIAEAKLEESLAEFPAEVEKAIASSQEKGCMDFTASLGDAGKAMLGMFLPLDLSTVQNVGLHVDAAMEENETKANLVLNVNGTPVVTLPFLMDLETLDFCLKAPDLTDKAVTGNYKTLFEMSAGSEEGAPDPAQMEEFLTSYFGMIKDIRNMDAQKVSDTMTSVCKTYSGIALKYIQDYDAYQDTVSIGNISKDGTIVSGYLYAKDIPALGTELIETAKADPAFTEFVGYLEKMGGSFKLDGQDVELTAENINAFFDSTLEQLQSAAESLEENDQDGILFDYVLDENQDIIGGDISLYEGTEIVVGLSATRLVDAENHEFDLSVNAIDDSFQLTGSAVETENGLEGSYTLYVKDAPTLLIDASPIALDGKSGHLVITLPEGEDANTNSSLALFSGFEVLVDFEATDTSRFCRLGLASSGAELAAIAIEGKNGADLEMTLPEKADFDGALNFFEDEAAQGEFLSSLNPDQIFTNLQTAGISEDLLNSIMGLILGEDPYAADDAA